MFKYINLQLFAVLGGDGAAHQYANATVASGSMGAGPVNNDLSDENKTFYDMTLIDEAQAQLVHDQFGVKKPIPAGSGKTIEFRKFHSYDKATTPLQEGVTPAGKAVKVTAITATVDQYGDYTMLTDVLDLTSIDPVVLETTKIHGRQAGLTLDTVTRNVLHSGTRVVFCPKEDGTLPDSRTKLTADCQLTVAVVKKVVAQLRASNAPTIDGKYVAIIHPYAAHDIMCDPMWIDAHQYTNVENIYEGEIGEIAGVRFVETSEAKVYKGAEDDCPEGLGVFGTLFLAEGAYGVTEITGGGLETIVKQLGSAGSADPLNQRSTVGWKGIKTAEILIPDYIVRVESCSKEFSATVEAN